MQKYYKNKKVLCFGEALWDVLPEGKKIGGAPLNVAYHLKKLGCNACLVSRIGKDALGRDLKDFLIKNSLSDSILQTDPVHPTGTVETKIGQHHEVAYHILENVAWDFIENNNELKGLVEQSEYLVYGSLATRSEVSRNMLYSLLENDLIKVLDVNLRAPFYSKELLQKLLANADIVKMNEAELHLLSEWFSYSENEIDKMKSLSDTFEIKILITTCGSKGAYLYNDNNVLFEPGYQIKVADTVGSGDAFLAGFLSGYIQDKPLAEALKCANKMGAFVAQKAGGCPDYNKVEIQQIKNSDLNTF